MAKPNKMSEIITDYIILPDRNNRFFEAKVGSKYESFNSNKQELTKRNSIHTTGVFPEITNKNSE